MMYLFIQSHRSEYSVVKMCRALEVSQSGFYDWLKRIDSMTKKRRLKLMERIKTLFFVKHKSMAGSPTITADLKDEPEFKNISRTRVAQLMKEMGLVCKIQKKFVATTDSKHDEPISENILNRNFSPEEPNQAIVGDITYIRVASHWVYLSVFIDLFSRKVVGWDLSESLKADSTCKALNKYLQNGVAAGLIIHSDRGVQYASKDFRKILNSIQAVQSMSRKGNCWDNSVAESFFHTLKTRLIHHRKYEAMEELNRDLFWYIEIYYNRERKHSANNWMTPEQKENMFFERKKVA